MDNKLVVLLENIVFSKGFSLIFLSFFSFNLILRLIRGNKQFFDWKTPDEKSMLFRICKMSIQRQKQSVEHKNLC